MEKSKNMLGISCRSADGKQRSFAVVLNPKGDQLKKFAAKLLQDEGSPFSEPGDMLVLEQPGTPCWNLSHGGRLICRCGTGFRDRDDPTLWREVTLYDAATPTAMQELELADLGEDGEFLRLVLEDLGIRWDWDGPAEERVEYAATLIRPAGLVILEKWYEIEEGETCRTNW